jgi:haloacetate dehalogenase
VPHTPDLADLFPGFAARRVPTAGGEVFARIGGSGPPLLLLHGYPQTHVMWHRVAPRLAERFTLVAADLPGYGASDIPETDAGHTPYTKRAMAQVMVDVMAQLGHDRFALAGHDRGGRVAYRLALDHPERLTRLAVLDILPTYDYWNRMDRSFALRIYHWAFLAQPSPLPERLIGADPDAYYTHTLGSWTRGGVEASFDPRAVAHYLSALRDPRRIHAACEDYRAGAYADFELDKADFEGGRRISVPMLVLWGGHGIAASATTPLHTWRQRADHVTGQPVDGGHFLPEENPDATAEALLRFLAAD